MLSFLKKLSPDFLKTIARKTRTKIYRLLEKTKPYLTHRKYCGFTLYYTRNAGLVDRIKFGNPNRTYEPELITPLTMELKKHKSPVFLDIGTNIGLVSLTVIHNIPEVKIYGFEPSPLAYKSFATTIFANQLEKNVHLYNEALDKQPGTVTFFAHGDYASCGDGMIDTQRYDGESNKITVVANSLDNWFRKDSIPKVNVVKIDIEGAELYALQGSVELLKIHKPVIFLEISVENLKVYPYKEKDVLRFFEENEYELFNLNGLKISSENISTIIQTEDTFIAKPKN